MPHQNLDCQRGKAMQPESFKIIRNFFRREVVIHPRKSGLVKGVDKTLHKEQKDFYTEAALRKNLDN